MLGHSPREQTGTAIKAHLISRNIGHKLRIAIGNSRIIIMHNSQNLNSIDPSISRRSLHKRHATHIHAQVVAGPDGEGQSLAHADRADEQDYKFGALGARPVDSLQNFDEATSGSIPT